ncbi:MAG: bifunctional helix-turn-helix transcriptional regulator/GNAT family N-acetyltransferase [Luteimonas sp.]
MANTELTEQVDALRAFNRDYTQRIGVLQEHLADSAFSLAQARTLYELAQRSAATAGELRNALGIDAGYLSRIIRGLVADGLVARSPSPRDARSRLLALTAQGRAAFAELDGRSHAASLALLAPLSDAARRRLLQAMRTVEHALSPSLTPSAPGLTIRTHRIGDIGWAIERHARLYAEEYAWNGEFEALVATLFAGFASGHDPLFERCWIAELDGERVGCVFVVRNTDDPSAAQLRCLLVDPLARGLGLGLRLVEECIAFARAAGYPRMRLWTNDGLVSARRIYERCGFELVEEYRHHSFGHDLVGQVWSKDLA